MFTLPKTELPVTLSVPLIPASFVILKLSATTEAEAVRLATLALPEILALVALMVVAVVSPKVAFAVILALSATKEPDATKCAPVVFAVILALSATTEEEAVRCATLALPDILALVALIVVAVVSSPKVALAEILALFETIEPVAVT